MDRDKSALMLGHSGAESVHAAMRNWSSQSRIGLVESCVQDASRAASQVGALNNFKKHGRKGQGPSIFELRIRDATVVGNVESFFPKLNHVLTQPDLREFSSAEPLCGEVETISMKRAGNVPTGPNITVLDSHRPDVVLVTRPKKRRFRGIANRDPTLLSGEPVVNLSSDDSLDTVVLEPQPRARRSEPVVIEETPPRATRARPSDPDVVVIQATARRAMRARVFDTEPVVIQETPPRVTRARTSDPDVVVIQATQRRATRSRLFDTDPVVIEETPPRAKRCGLSDQEPVAASGGERDPERVPEADVRRGMLFVARISTHGKSPGCRGSKCGRLIRDEGLKRSDVGVIGILWLASSNFAFKGDGYAYWFCPNGQCCKKCSLSSSITGALPQIPSTFPVSRGTNLSEQEVRFLKERGVYVGAVDSLPFLDEGVSSGDIILDLNTYPERVNAQRPDARLTRRNSIPRRRRSDIGEDARTRIRSAKVEAMVCRSITKIETGNATGLRVMVNNVSSGIASVHCVQICVFPTCSCRDFMDRESKVKTYFPCKHMYWCFAKICNRDIDNDQSINQPILTLGEVRNLVSGASID